MMTLDYQPYPFLEHLKLPSQLGCNLRDICEVPPWRKRDDLIDENFYLKVLCSLSLSFIEKHRVLINVRYLTQEQVRGLQEVLSDELKEFTNTCYNKEPLVVLELVLKSLHSLIILCRVYQIFANLEEEKKIMGKIITEWILGRPEIIDDFEEHFQTDNQQNLLEKIISYYQSQQDKNE